MLNITVPAHATGLPEGRLLGRDLSSATLLSTAQLLDLLGGRETVEATIEGLIGLLDDTDAPGEDREPANAGFFGPGDDREDEDEHGTDLDHGEADDADYEVDGAFIVGGIGA